MMIQLTFRFDVVIYMKVVCSLHFDFRFFYYLFAKTYPIWAVWASNIIVKEMGCGTHVLFINLLGVSLTCSDALATYLIPEELATAALRSSPLLENSCWTFVRNLSPGQVEVDTEVTYTFSRHNSGQLHWIPPMAVEFSTLFRQATTEAWIKQRHSCFHYHSFKHYC